MEQKEAKRRFYRFPMLVIPFVAAYILYRLELYVFRLRLPTWAYIAAAIAVVAGTIVAEAVAWGVSKAWLRDDERLKKQTAFIQWLRMETETIESHAAAGRGKDALHKLSEAARYSDPMSDERLAAEEEKLAALCVSLADAVAAKKEEEIVTLCDQGMQLLEDRNRMCKAYPRRLKERRKTVKIAARR